MDFLGSLVLLGKKSVLFILRSDELFLRAGLFDDGGKIHLTAQF